MSSPMKKIKLTPTKSTDSRPRNTQESKVTSTPQRLSGRVVSPNLSSISSTSSKGYTGGIRISDISADQKDDTGTPYSNQESNRSSPFSGVSQEKFEIISVQDYDAFIDEFQRIKYAGKVWMLYKPVHNETLYAHILNDPQNIQEVATELLLLYTRKPESAICKLLKLCVDVCGFQNFEVADHYNFQEDVSKRVIEIMQTSGVINQQEVLLDTGRYLFMEPRTDLSKALKTSIYIFLHKLITYTHDRAILYDGFFNKHFFIFIKSMAFSELRAIRHTGVVFGMKILTTLVLIYSKIIEENNSSNQSSSDNIQLQKQEINNYMEFFYFIFIKNCCLQDDNVVLMKVECIHELTIWIRYFPKIFIGQLQLGSYLLKFLTDPFKEVRYAALETCEALVQTASTRAVLKATIPDFTEHIGKRFYDIDFQVTIKAIDIYNFLYKYDPHLISTHRFKELINLIFNKHFPIGEAASKFLINYLEIAEDNQETLLLNLAKLSKKPGYAVKQLLIEGCIENCAVIRNWELYIHILKHCDVAVDLKEHLAELFAEAFHQVSIGRATIMREKLRKATINIDDVMSITKHIPIFATLLEMYKDHPKILIELLKIISLTRNIIWDEISNHKVLENICLKMEKLFDYHHDEAILKKICETFEQLSRLSNYKNCVGGVTEAIVNRYKHALVTNLTSLNEDTGKTALKASILFAHFDLSKNIKWEILYDTCGEVDESVRSSLLCCCKWFLIWKLKNLPNHETPATRFPLLLRSCREFTSSCINTLQHLKGQPLHFQTYNCLCDFYITYMKSLEELIKSFKQMEQLKLVIDEIQLQRVFILFLETHVICNPRMPLSERRLYVVKYIDLIHIGVLSNECLTNIFRYFYMYNKEYGPIIESSLSSISKADENTFLMIILYTLTEHYEDILSKYNVIDMTIMETKSLTLLIKQFLTLKELKSDDRRLAKLVHFGIFYSCTDESKYYFLYFLKYFVDFVQKSDRKVILSTSNLKPVDAINKYRCVNLLRSVGHSSRGSPYVYSFLYRLDFLKSKVPKSAEKNEAILFFASYLKSLNPGIMPKKKMPAKTSKENKENETPKKKTEVSLTNDHKRGTATNVKKPKEVETETDISEDDLTIHDSESDDLEESISTIRI